MKLSQKKREGFRRLDFVLNAKIFFFELLWGIWKSNEFPSKWSFSFF